MKIKQKKLDDGRIQIDAVATSGEVARALDVAQYAFAQQMGLRQEGNKTIAEVAESTMGINDLDSVVESQAAEFLAPFAIDKSGITPAFPPQPMAAMPLKRGYDYGFKLYVTPKPAYELSSYDPVEITVQPFELDQKLVDDKIDEIVGRWPLYVKDPGEPHAIAKGDHLLLSMDAYRDGERVDALSTDSRTYTAGMGFMPEGFDDQIVGMMPGETKTFSFEGPTWDPETQQEGVETIDCTVTVLENQIEQKQELTEDYVQTNFPQCENIAGFRKMIEQEVEQEARFAYEEQVRQGAAAAISDRFEGRIDDAIYESMQKTLISNLRQQLQQQDMSYDEYVEKIGGREQFNMMSMMETRSVLVQGFCLDAVFRHFKLHVKEEDIIDVCRTMRPDNPKRAKLDLEQGGRSFVLQEAAERLRANKYLVEHATIIESEKE